MAQFVDTSNVGQGRPTPKAAPGLAGRGCPRWGNPACAAFERETPTALVAKRSAVVIPCGPAPRRPAYTKHDARTRRSPSAHRHHFSTSTRVGFGVDLFGSNRFQCTLGMLGLKFVHF
jgi:hypothetical protein